MYSRLIFIELNNMISVGDDYILRNSSLCYFIHIYVTSCFLRQIESNCILYFKIFVGLGGGQFESGRKTDSSEVFVVTLSTSSQMLNQYLN
jgi:hypothetical protein